MESKEQGKISLPSLDLRSWICEEWWENIGTLGRRVLGDFGNVARFKEL